METRWIWGVLSALAIAACGDGESESQPGLRKELESSGVSISQLFQTPDDAELEAIRADWMSRDLSVRNVIEEMRSRRANGDTVVVLSHELEAGVRYGAIVIPENASESMPVVVNSIGFGPPYQLDLTPARSAFGGGFITVLPGFRGHTLILDDQTWRSDGPRFDQCDGGTDDMLTFLRVALEHEPAADRERIYAFGGSRGGNVSMLASAREPSIRGVVSLAGPTSYVVEDYLEHPNLSNLYARWFVRELLEDPSQVESARVEMVACSPLFFIESLPALQLHHGESDRSVPVENTEAFEEAWGRERPGEVLEVFYYPDEGHSFAGSLDTVSDRAERFLTDTQ
ncbi:MAG: prolyl oligopeptidase family serine peptidase [Myxococcota bacterium]